VTGRGILSVTIEETYIPSTRAGAPVAVHLERQSHFPYVSLLLSDCVHPQPPPSKRLWRRSSAYKNISSPESQNNPTASHPERRE